METGLTDGVLFLVTGIVSRVFCLTEAHAMPDNDENRLFHTIPTVTPSSSPAKEKNTIQYTPVLL